MDAHCPAPEENAQIEQVTPRGGSPTQTTEEVSVASYGLFLKKAASVLGYRMDVCLPVDGSSWSHVAYRQASSDSFQINAGYKKFPVSILAVGDHLFYVLREEPA